MRAAAAAFDTLLLMPNYAAAYLRRYHVSMPLPTP